MIFKYVKNTKKEGNKVSGRYKYVVSKADWIYENTIERFDFMVKRRFGEKQDTTHYVLSSDRLLSEQEKEKAREVISNFFFNKFGAEHFLSIAEHNDNGKTHYHILLSRDIITGKMVNTKIKAKEWKELQKELRAEMEQAGILTEKEKIINEKYLSSTEKSRTFGQYEYRSYKELSKQLQRKTSNEKIDFLLYLFEKSENSYKAITRATSELIAELLNNAEIELLNSFLEQSGINIFLETTQKGRERIKISFEKDWKFLENAKTTTFRVSNLNKNIANQLKAQLKELQNGIKELDRKIFEQNRELETDIPKPLQRVSEVDAGIGEYEKGDKTSTGRKKYDIGRSGRIETGNSEFAEFERQPSAGSGRRKDETDEFEELARAERERNERYRKRIERIRKQLEELERLKEQKRRNKTVYIDVFGKGTGEPKKEKEKKPSKNTDGSITLDLWGNSEDRGISFDR